MSQFFLAMEMQIRRMLASDAEHIHKLVGQLGYDLTEAETQRQIDAVLQREDHCAYVAVIEQQVIGWIQAFIALTIESRPFVEIGGLVIDVGFRGKGIGKDLVEKVKEWCAAKNLSSVRVRSNAKRKDAHAFYLKLGFAELKEQKVFNLPL